MICKRFLIIVLALGALWVISMFQILPNLELMTIAPAAAQGAGQVKGVLVYENTGKPAIFYLQLARCIIVNEAIEGLKYEGEFFVKPDSSGVFHFMNVDRKSVV